MREMELICDVVIQGGMVNGSDELHLDDNARGSVLKMRRKRFKANIILKKN